MYSYGCATGRPPDDELELDELLELEEDDELLELEDELDDELDEDELDEDEFTSAFRTMYDHVALNDYPDLDPDQIADFEALIEGET